MQAYVIDFFAINIFQLAGRPIPLGQTLLTYLSFTAIIIARYFFIVWPIHHMLWRRPADTVKARRLSKRNPSAATIRNEIKLSTISAFIYAAPAAIVLEMWKAGGTAMYSGLPQGLMGWGWILVSALIYLFAQDTWFYWTHRVMHHRKLFKWTHEGHHRSVQPTPWASFSFDAIEAISAAWLLSTTRNSKAITGFTFGFGIRFAGRIKDWLEHPMFQSSQYL